MKTPRNTTVCRTRAEGSVCSVNTAETQRITFNQMRSLTVVRINIFLRLHSQTCDNVESMTAKDCDASTLINSNNSSANVGARSEAHSVKFVA